MDAADNDRDEVVVVGKRPSKDQQSVKLQEGLLDNMAFKDTSAGINWRTLYIPQRVTRHIRRELEGSTESPVEQNEAILRSPTSNTRRRRSSVIVVEEQHAEPSKTDEDVGRGSKHPTRKSSRHRPSDWELEPIVIQTEVGQVSRKRRRPSTASEESSSTASSIETQQFTDLKIQSQNSATPTDTPTDSRMKPSSPPDNRVSIKNGQWQMKGNEWQFMVRHSCQRCMQLRKFCDRGQPCGSCSRLTITCRRKPGLSALRAKKERSREDANRIHRKGKAHIFQGKSKRNDFLNKRPYIRRNTFDSDSSSHRAIVELLKFSSTSDNTSHIKTIVKKPQALGKPKVWCETRQELCESVPYFRSFQSGIYVSEGVPYGYMLDGFGAPRDIFHNRVIISHGGGKSGAYDGGKFGLLSSQQSSDNTISALLASQKLKRPIILIAGSKYEACTFEMPHRYCILGWYVITDSWAEGEYHHQLVRVYDRQNGQETDESDIGRLETQKHLLVRWKFRFEWLPQQGRPFWEETELSATIAHPAVEPESEPTLHHLDAPSSHFCQTCRLSSPLVYANAAMCLRDDCKAFWNVYGNGEISDPPEDLQYSEAFLRVRNSTREISVPFDVVPPTPPDAASYANRTDMTRVFWRGFHCKACGRLSCREKWDGWECRNCHNTLTPGRRVFSAQEVLNVFRPIYSGTVMDNGNPIIGSEVDIQYEQLLHQGTCMKQNIFTFPSVDEEPCRVIHLLGNSKQNLAADELFREYQASRIPFRRHELKSHKLQGRFLVNQFSYNAGVAYKHVVAMETTAMNEAPNVVQESMALLQERVQDALERMQCYEAINFNEILAIAYMEEQKMGFHDDGEEGVGAVIASMSFGSEAIMQFRQKSRMARQYNGNEKIFEEAEIEHDQEQEQEDEYVDMDDEAFDMTWQASNSLPLPKSFDDGKQPARDLFRTANSRSRLALQLTLHHGDVLIMQGSGIQKYYEVGIMNALSGTDD